MDETTKVLLITGFLGSGKTTFLNRIIDVFPKDKKLTILMNEFGEIGIDGTLVEGDDIDMMEISRGSIFCVCVKTDFIKGLYELNTTIQPDLLIIESTGVANPSELKRDLQLPIFNDRFEFTDQFCIIDAAHFIEAFDTFASVEKQLSSSTVFIINKTDMVEKDVIERIKQVVQQHHPDPLFYETTFSNIPMDSFPFLASKANELQAVEQAQTSSSILSSKELDEFIGDLLNQPGLETTPPDQLASVTYKWNGSAFEEIKNMAKNLPASVIRAKGFVQEKGGELHLFSYVMGDWTLETCTKDSAEIKHMNMVVFIGGLDAMDGIAQAVKTGHWSGSEVLQPMLQTSIM